MLLILGVTWLNQCTRVFGQTPVDITLKVFFKMRLIFKSVDFEESR